MAVGRGRSGEEVLRQYRVTDIHNKYYSKWFMAKVPRNKVFGKDSKYKLKVHMQEVSAVQEYINIDLEMTGTSRRTSADCSQMMR